MNKVPQIISTKDLSYISDMFEWMMTAAKKANHYGNEVQDAEIKKLCDAICQMHTKHCQKLVNILQGGNQ